MPLTTVTCHEATCDHCDYKLDEDEEGAIHLSEDPAEARRQLRDNYDWRTAADGRLFCPDDECVAAAPAETEREPTAGQRPLPGVAAT